MKDCCPSHCWAALFIYYHIIYVLILCLHSYSCFNPSFHLFVVLMNHHRCNNVYFLHYIFFDSFVLICRVLQFLRVEKNNRTVCVRVFVFIKKTSCCLCCHFKTMLIAVLLSTVMAWVHPHRGGLGQYWVPSGPLGGLGHLRPSLGSSSRRLEMDSGCRWE